VLLDGPAAEEALRRASRALTHPPDPGPANRLGDQGKALTFCDRLEKECGQDITAADVRIPILLNAGLWEPAAQAARYVHRIYPATNLPLALALYEMGEKRRAQSGSCESSDREQRNTHFRADSSPGFHSFNPLHHGAETAVAAESGLGGDDPRAGGTGGAGDA